MKCLKGREKERAREQASERVNALLNLTGKEHHFESNKEQTATEKKINRDGMCMEMPRESVRIKQVLFTFLIYVFPFH